MNPNGKHRRTDPWPAEMPRRSVLLGGGVLLGSAALGVAAALGPSAEHEVANAANTTDDTERTQAARDGESRPSRRSRRSGGGAPLIHSTDDWGARTPYRRATVLSRAPEYIVVHHTFTPNVTDYSLRQGYRIARSIQGAHMGQGWGDTGQHFTISRGGHIMEGRKGSLAAARRGRMVIGTHVAGANGYTVGIECEGTYNSVMPPRRLLDSLTELLAWLCGQYDLDPKKAIVPHMKFNDTDCCGYEFAPTLPRLRKDVAAALRSA
ncbi:peptidoglycan recognition family protein [Actinomadura miaoliensis]|uniref:N-acetylmuramoyl-L-alanine amidase n=1 Tax=Actinomadura miaoliensis TaxID=430685 RepID=A0ABP7VCI1_9ACTN